MADLKINQRFESGEIKCHWEVDLVLTPDGDIALTSTPAEELQQRLLVYWATPKGEMLDPHEGSSIYQYLHKPLTPDTLQEMALDIKNDLQESFPELAVTSVKIQRGDRNYIYMIVYCSEGALKFLCTPDGIIEFNKMITESGIKYTPGVLVVQDGSVY